jgi:hypothetical protein
MWDSKRGTQYVDYLKEREHQMRTGFDAFFRRPLEIKRKKF